MASVEIKAQRRWVGKLFLEVWNNKNLDDRGWHIERGSTPGWLITCRAAVLGFHFIDADTVLFLPLFRLQQLVFGIGDAPGRSYDFPERQQRRYVQRNDSWGRVVPIETLAREAGMKRAGLRQGELWRRSPG